MSPALESGSGRIFSYIAYGLGIKSALPLPELFTVNGSSDVTIRIGSVAPVLSGATTEGCVRATAEEVHLFWKDAGAFLVRKGHEIIVDPVPGAEERVLRLCILGPALGVLLHQRKRLVLHASAVAMAGKAVAFLGEAGQGKSTMAAALYAQGYRLVADDVTALQVAKGCVMANPGVPQLKLWPEAAHSLGDDPETLPRLEPNLEKRARRVPVGFSPAPLPLKRVYVLAEGETPKVEPIDRQDALVELIRHTYVPRLLKSESQSWHLLQCASVVNTVLIRRLERPRSLLALADVVSMVEEDIARSTE